LGADGKAVPTNGQMLTALRSFVTELWQRALRRRGHKNGTTSESITRLADD
jgi:RNA-directed DNA polymerase